MKDGDEADGRLSGGDASAVSADAFMSRSWITDLF
jgi:hypothetical protein